MEMRILKCTVNGKEVQVGYDPRESLLDTLHDRLGLTSVKRGCEVGECGACTVLIDDVATDTCLYLTDWAQGKNIETVEGLQAPDGTLDPVQQAYVDEFAVQCGFCIPGLIMSTEELVRSGKTYTRTEIRKALSGHLCRCTGYQNVLNAVEKAIEVVHGMVGEEENVETTEK
jgi:carbon-monoxide dehydrogenase small subunit